MQTAIPCFQMRGGTSKGAYFLASDLPDDVAARDRILLAVMGSPDKRQIDGIGGADPLTSKVAIVSRSSRPGIDVDYLFCQVWVDRAEVSTQQNCGNILAAVAPFAIERGLVAACDGETKVRIFMVNTSQTVIATVKTPGKRPEYDGDAAIDGVPGTAAPIPLSFADTAGSTCGALLPTGRAVDVVHGVRVTCIDNGMPVVVMRADQMGRTGYETREALDDDAELKARVEAGLIGDLLVMHQTSRWSIAEDWFNSGTPGWFADPRHVPGGALIDEGIYQIDYMTWLAGSPVAEVEARTANLVHRTSASRIGDSRP